MVATPQSQVPYAVVGPDGEPVASVQDYLAELLAADCSPLTLRSYAFDLLDWFRFLAAAGVAWQAATRIHVRDWVLALRSRPNPRSTRGGGDRGAPGAGDQRSGTPSRRDGYAPATINHRLSVVAGFYRHHARLGDGPTVNPVPDEGRTAADAAPTTTRSSRGRRDPVAATGRGFRGGSRGRSPTSCTSGCSRR